MDKKAPRPGKRLDRYLDVLKGLSIVLLGIYLTWKLAFDIDTAHRSIIGSLLAALLCVVLFTLGIALITGRRSDDASEEERWV